MQVKMKKILAMEFVRYTLAGIVATVADFGVLVLLREVLFPAGTLWLYLAVALGFLAGVCVSYALAVRFVFQETKRTRGIKGRVLFFAISLSGLALTEMGMVLGTNVWGLHYIPMKAVMTVIVLFWNYFGKKWFVF